MDTLSLFPRRVLLVALLAGLAVAPAPAQTQSEQEASQSAFAEYAESLRFAMASQVLGLRLQALTVALPGTEAKTTAAGKTEEEAKEGPPIPLLALFAGSLAQSDPALLQALEGDLQDVRRLAESGENAALALAVGRVQRDLARVREVLLPDELAGDPAFQAALIAKLANSGRGFGEGYEEAANGEVSAYPLAWLTLQRVQALWNDLAGELPAAREEANLALKALHGLMPTVQPPDAFSDPEDVEGEALNLVFALEGALNQPLMMRGFAAPLALMQRQVEDACKAAEAGLGRLALENALAARITYTTHLASPLSMLASEVHADVSALWRDLDALRAGKASAVCQTLKDAVKRARATLG